MSLSPSTVRFFSWVKPPGSLKEKKTIWIQEFDAFPFVWHDEMTKNIIYTSCINNLICLYNARLEIVTRMICRGAFPHKRQATSHRLLLPFISRDASTSCWEKAFTSTQFFSGMIRMHLVWTNILKSGDYSLCNHVHNVLERKFTWYWDSASCIFY